MDSKEELTDELGKVFERALAVAEALEAVSLDRLADFNESEERWIAAFRKQRNDKGE